MEIPENVRRSSLGIFQSCPFSHVAISNVLVAKYWINLGKGNRSAMSHVTQSLEQFRALMYVWKKRSTHFVSLVQCVTHLSAALFASHKQSWLSGDSFREVADSDLHPENTVKWGGEQSISKEEHKHTFTSSYALCGHMSTHSQANAAFQPPTAQFPLKHPKRPFRESGIDGGKERGRPGVVNGGWIGVEGVPMHAEPEIHSSRPGLRASHTYTNALIVIHRPTLSSLETPRAL